MAAVAPKQVSNEGPLLGHLGSLFKAPTLSADMPTPSKSQFLMILLKIFVEMIFCEFSIILKVFALHTIDENSILCIVLHLETMKLHSKSSADSVLGPIFFKTEFRISIRGSTIYWKS